MKVCTYFCISGFLRIACVSELSVNSTVNTAHIVKVAAYRLGKGCGSMYGCNLPGPSEITD